MERFNLILAGVAVTPCIWVSLFLLPDIFAFQWRAEMERSQRTMRQRKRQHILLFDQKETCLKINRKLIDYTKLNRLILFVTMIEIYTREDAEKHSNFTEFIFGRMFINFIISKDIKWLLQIETDWNQNINRMKEHNIYFPKFIS